MVASTIESAPAMPALALQQQSRTSPAHSPAQIASEPKVRDVKISPDGRQVVYQVLPFYRAADRTVSQLWLAMTDTKQSARPITNGHFNDRAAVFHPDGRRLMFLSDRHNPGKGTQVFALDLTFPKDDEPVLVSSSFGKKPVQGFEISPDGHFILFMSADDAEDTMKAERDSDAKEYGEKSGLSRLRVLTLSTGEVQTLNMIRRDWHVESATWNSDSRRLLYRLRQNRGSEHTEQEVLLESVSIDGDEQPVAIGSFPRAPSGQNIWLPSGHIATLQNYEARNVLDARTLHLHRCDIPSSLADDSLRLYGAQEDAVRLVNMSLPKVAGRDRGSMAVEVCCGTDTHIDVIDFTRDGVDAHFTLFKTQEDAIWFNSWDAKRVIDEDGKASYVFAAVLSSGIRHEPPNVWAGRVAGKQGGMIPHKIRLSSHLQWLVDAPTLKTEVISWIAPDGTQLNGLARYPPGYVDSWGPLPTVLFIHGGPYR